MDFWARGLLFLGFLHCMKPTPGPRGSTIIYGKILETYRKHIRTYMSIWSICEIYKNHATFVFHDYIFESLVTIGTFFWIVQWALLSRGVCRQNQSRPGLPITVVPDLFWQITLFGLFDCFSPPPLLNNVQIQITHPKMAVYPRRVPLTHNIQNCVNFGTDAILVS